MATTRRILILGIRNNGGRPCHRCLIKESELGNLGAPNDTERRDALRCEVEQAQLVRKAQRFIASGEAVTGKQVEEVMREHSLIPIAVGIIALHKRRF